METNTLACGALIGSKGVARVAQNSSTYDFSLLSHRDYATPMRAIAEQAIVDRNKYTCRTFTRSAFRPDEI